LLGVRKQSIEKSKRGSARSSVLAIAAVGEAGDDERGPISIAKMSTPALAASADAERAAEAATATAPDRRGSQKQLSQAFAPGGVMVELGLEVGAKQSVLASNSADELLESQPPVALPAADEESPLKDALRRASKLVEGLAEVFKSVASESVAAPAAAAAEPAEARAATRPRTGDKPEQAGGWRNQPGVTQQQPVKPGPGTTSARRPPSTRGATPKPADPATNAALEAAEKHRVEREKLMAMRRRQESQNAAANGMSRTASTSKKELHI
jgi:hypothetical protein